MAQVFLSYDRDDADRARPLALALEKAGHSVWWDLHVRGGAQFSKVIEEALKAADAVVVLWSRNSIESNWVRDEAAAGRDSGRLVPVTLDGTEPPLGFRQFQTIDLSQWKGRGKPAQLSALLADVEALAASRAGTAAPTSSPASRPAAAAAAPMRRLLVPALIVLAIIAGAASYWFLAERGPGPPRIAVAAADPRPLSQDMARNLLVKLGALQGNAVTNVRLLNAPGENESANLRFTVNGAERNGQIHANVVLVSGDEKTMLWSKEFEQPTRSRSDLEEALAFAAARVLACALEETSGKYGRLSQDLRRVYLNACAALAELGWDNRSVLPQLRRVTVEAPKFRPAWARLLTAQADYVSYLSARDQGASAERAALKGYIEAARRVDPNMAEATLAELELKPRLSIAEAIALVDKAKAQDPQSATVLAAHSQLMQRVGRMRDALEDALQAAELDPLSPYIRTSLISVLMYSGQADRARAELARAKQLWPGTQTIREAEHALELRLGDFEKAVRVRGELGPGFDLYARARRDPTDTNVAAFLAFVRPRPNENFSRVVFGLQALGEMNRVDDFYTLAGEIKNYHLLSGDSYVLFRPWLASIRRDPRFIGFAKRLGLVDYWQKSGNWPDFCEEPGIPYDCRAEAAKYG